MMDATSGLLQYYVHRMLKYRRQEEEGAGSPSRQPKKFRSRATRSYLVHEYNFLKEGASEPSSPDKSNNRSKELDRTATPTQIGYKKYKQHQKRQSLQTDLKQQIAEVVRRTEIDFYKPSVQPMTVSALRMGSPPRTASYEPNSQLRLTATKCEYASHDSLEDVRGIVGTVRCLKRGTELLGLEIRRLELEKQRDYVDRQKRNEPATTTTTPASTAYSAVSSNHKLLEPVKNSAALSQQLIRPVKRRLLDRTIISLNGQSLDTIFEEKARNYRELLFVVYVGCSHYKDAQLCSVRFDRKLDMKHEYFVGRGNNSNLIRSLMKKRWWWQPTNELTAETKFVWTQRKIDTYFDRQDKGCWYQPDKQIPPKMLKPLDSQLKLEDEVQLRRLLHPQDMEVYKQYARALKKQPHSLASRMKLLRKRPLHQLPDSPPMQNHFECNYHLGNKKALLRNLTHYYRFHSISEEHWNIPMTFHILNPQDKEFKRFAAIFRQNERKNPSNNVWIVKPGENSNRGQGIKVSRSLKQIANLLQNKEHTYVVQQYLGELLLYQRRKFDIRTYCLVTRIGGVLKAYWYQEGYIRTASEPYQLQDLSDPMVHLTNDAIQKFGENYGKYEPGNKLSYAELQRYLETTYPQNPLYDVQKLVEHMKQIATEAVKACYFRLDPNQRSFNFEVFGLDFLIDERFRPWLLEVNTNPCLQLSSPLLARIIPKMVDNALRLGLDPIYPPTACPYNCKPYLSDNSLQKNRFELIFDSQYDRLPSYQCSQTEFCSYDCDDELYDNEGQFVNVAD